jgi:hypothetical protein
MRRGIIILNTKPSISGLMLHITGGSALTDNQIKIRKDKISKKVVSQQRKRPFLFFIYYLQ